MFAGRVVEHRQIQGDQLWTVVVTVERGPQVETHTLRPDQRIPLGALQGLVATTIAELCADKAPITRARMDFLVHKPRSEK